MGISYKEQYESYLPLLKKDGDIYSNFGGKKVPLTIFITDVLATCLKKNNGEADFFWKILDTMLEGGADFTKVVYGNFSPLSYLENFQDTSWGIKIRDHIINKSLNSATEAVAFEFDKQSIVNGLKKVGNFIKERVGIDKGIFRDKKAGGSTLREMRDQHQGRDKDAPAPLETGENAYKSDSKDPNELNEKVDKYTTEGERVLFIRNALDDRLGAQAKSVFAKALAKEKTPFTTELYQVTEVLARGNGGKPLPKIAADIITSYRYGGIVRELNKHGMGGFNPILPDPGKKGEEEKLNPGLSQLRILAYYCEHGYDTNDLRKGGKWASLTEMKRIVNSLKVKKPEAKYNEATGAEITEWMKKLGWPKDIRFEDSTAFRGWVKEMGYGPLPPNGAISRVNISGVKKMSGSPFTNLQNELKRLAGAKK